MSPDKELANAPALSLLTYLDEPPVQPALGHQLRMGALLDDAAVLYHQDLVGVLDGGQPVGDGEDGLSFRQGGQGLLDQVLILRVREGGGLVQNHDGRVLQNRPGDGDALALAAGEGGAPLPDHRVIPIWQGHDEVMAAGSFTQGSTIELSADAPVIEPYTLYLQGGLTLEYGKLSILLALSNMKGKLD